VLDGSACQNITVRNCPAQLGVLTDGFGAYSCFSSFCGTTGTVTNGNRHVNINIIEGCFATALARAGCEVNNWQSVTVTGCSFNNPQTPYLTTIDGVLGANPLYFVYDINSPRVYSPVIVNNVINITETIVCQFSVPPNDWDAGQTCYRHHHTGRITCPAGATLTIKIYIGVNGNVTDTLCSTINITFTVPHNNDAYCFDHDGFDTDDDGGWNPRRWRFDCGRNDSQEGHDTVRPFPPPGQRCYVTHTSHWDSNAGGRNHICKRGNHEREKQ
jgi:hypothetical protein